MADNTTVEKRPVGAPTVFTEKTLQELKSAFLMDSTDEEACLNADIAPSSLYNYQKEHPEFLEQKRKWKQNPFLKARKTIFAALDNPETAKWYMERKARTEFATRRENLNAEVDINDLLDKMETNYATVAGEAQKQMVEAKSFVQDQGQTGEPDNVQA